MREALQLHGNDLLRGLLRRSIRLTGRAMRWELERKIASFRRDQEQLRARYDIGPSTPIRTYDDQVRRSVESFAAAHPDARFAYTSGSTAQPKKIAFTRARLRTIKRGNLSVVARTMLRHPVPGGALFILSGLKDDDSLSSLILSDRGRQTPYLSGLLMPARYLAQPAMSPHLQRYGATAARLWLMVLSNPGMVYSTNPSTLALFLTDLYRRWPETTAMVRDFARAPASFDDATHRIARRVATPDWAARAQRVAAADTPLPMAEMCPGLTVYCCWDGGYVRPFLDQVRAYLPAERFRMLPMYSMSTESLETVTYFDGDQTRFLTLAPGVLYELLPEGLPDDPAQLIAPWELEPGARYTLVLSDAYGLVRYQTEDIFECAGIVGDVPDLRFLRRRGLTYSFTGEKLTDSQLEQAFARLRDAVPALPAAGVQLALIPSRPDGAVIPRYRLALAHPGNPPDVDPADVAAQLDRILGDINRELADKQASGRLGPTLATVLPYDDLAAHLDPKTRDAGDRAGRVWDTQFKLLPLYKRLWHEYGLPGD